MRSFNLVNGGFMLALSVACAKEPSPRPPWANQDCTGSGCGAAVSPVGQGAGDASVELDAGKTDAGEVDAADVGANDATSKVVVEPQSALELGATSSEPLGLLGDVYELTELSATSWQSMLALAVGGAELSVSGEGQWFWFSQDPANQWLATVSWLTPKPSKVIVPVYPRQFLDDMAAGLSNSPVALNSALGHVVLRVTNIDGVALPSVSAEVATGVIAYGVGGTATDFQMETGETGTIVWLNAKTGGAASLVLKYGAQTQNVVLPVLPASVTVAVVALNLQMP